MLKFVSLRITFSLILDEKSNFDDHVKFISMVERLSTIVPSDALLTIFKPFVKSHLDYKKCVE